MQTSYTKHTCSTRLSDPKTITFAWLPKRSKENFAF